MHLLQSIKTLLLLSTGAAAAEPLQQVLNSKRSSPFDEDFEQLAVDTLNLFHVPGTSIGVVDGDDTWAIGYGLSNLPSTKAGPETLWEAGSTTKAFTATIMSLLVDDNENHPDVKWTTPIADLIRDDFVLEDPYWTSHMTVEDALSHRTGMPRHDLAYGSLPRDLVRTLRYLPLTAAPRTKFQYCNMMYITISHAIETLTAAKLSDVIFNRILYPLSMHSTYFSADVAKAAPETLADGYYYANDTFKTILHLKMEEVSGAGFIITNVLDYSKWIRSMLRQDGPISKEGYEELLSARSIMEIGNADSPTEGPTYYSLGWYSSVYKGYKYITHNGGTTGFGTVLIYFPNLDYGVVCFANTGTTYAQERLVWQLIDDRIGVPAKERFDRNKKNLKDIKDAQMQYDNALSTFFPSIPDPPIQHALNISSYTGSYTHPGYGITKFFINDDGNLQADRTDRTWKQRIVLEHVSGEFWLGNMRSLDTPDGDFMSFRFPAEFVIDSKGVAGTVGLRMEEAIGDEKIWFSRI